MSSFTVSFNGRFEDLVREIGMSLNGLIRKLVGEEGTKPLRSTFMRPENAETGWIKDHVVLQVAIALWQKPNEARGLGTIADDVRTRYKLEVEEWIEENRAKLAEIGFLRDDDEPVRFDRYGRRTSQ